LAVFLRGAAIAATKKSKGTRIMNASKTMLFAIGAAFMTTGTALEASAHHYEGRNVAPKAAFASFPSHAVQRLIGGQASLQPYAGSRVAINPQPLPPGGEE
jgi:hypothetical protein